MKLFRISYLRDGHQRHMTIAKRNLALATEFAYNTMQSYTFSIGGSLISDVQPC